MNRLYQVCVTLLFFILLNEQLAAQAGMRWAKSFKGGGDEYGFAVTVDAHGNVYTTGTFSSTVDFDPGPGVFNLTVVGGFNSFVSKLDKDGNFVWAKSLGGQISEDYGQDIAVDDSGNVYTTGTFSYLADFDPGPNSYELLSMGYHDTYISKLDKNGDFVWAKQLASQGQTNTTVWSIALDKKGNVYTTGELLGWTDFDPGPGTYLLPAQFANVFISKLNNNGDFVWAKLLGGENIWGMNNGQSIAIDKTGNVYTTGYFIGPSDFDPDSNAVFTLNSQGDHDAFVSKLDENGKFVWAKDIGGKGETRGSEIALDGNNNVYTTGYFSDTTDFDPGSGIFSIPSKGHYDIYISKIDSAGNFKWAKSMGGRQYDQARGIAVDHLGNIYTTGSFSDTADFDPGPGVFNLNTFANWDYNAFVSKLDASGNFLWAKHFAQAKEADHGNTWSNGYAIAVDDQENVYTTGEFSGKIDFNPGYNQFKIEAYKDAYVHKIGPCQPTIGGVDVRNECNNFTWVDGKTYTQNNNTAQFNIENVAGCDSLVTLNLTIHKVDTSVTLSSGSLVSNATGVTYQWRDCNDNYAPIPGATGQSFTPPYNGIYAVEVGTAGCTDTSQCYLFVVTDAHEKEAGYNEWAIAPNPTNGTFVISTNAALHVPVQVRILNLLGEVVQECDVTTTRASIQLLFNHREFIL